MQAPARSHYPIMKKEKKKKLNVDQGSNMRSGFKRDINQIHTQLILSSQTMGRNTALQQMKEMVSNQIDAMAEGKNRRSLVKIQLKNLLGGNWLLRTKELL